MIPLGIRHFNPFNLEVNPHIHWEGEVLTADGTQYCSFSDPVFGLRAGMIDVRSKIARGLNTVEKILNVFAPSSENDTSAYIGDICSRLSITSTTPLKLDTIHGLTEWAKFIIHHENGSPADGGDWYHDDTYIRAAVMALEHE